ncbi:N-acetylmuramoyl-L-alanine amidase [Pelagibacteraceae bacterium]|nr:N-acetylmuramoyl-L-alanine amidase [Pelagibacteraceae bacterium]
MEITKFYSPNFDKKKRLNKNITAIIIHYTGMQSERESIKRLTSMKSKVSCHYLINRSGKIFKMVKEENVAWHAGKSMWGKYKNLNENSIGIELVNKGHQYGYQNYTKKQINKLVLLCKYLIKKYKINKRLILGHSDIAPLRKIDPGEKFPWKYLSSKGIGIYPKKILLKKKNYPKLQFKRFLKNLHTIGYRYLNTNLKKKIIKNFQRRFRQRKINGILDLETMKISQFLSKNQK